MKWRGNHGATLDHKRLCPERLRQRLPVERPWTVCKGSVVSFFSEIALLNTKCANDKSFVPLIALNVLSVLALSSHHTVDKGLTIAIEIVSFVYRYFCLEILACVAANEALRLVRSTKIGKEKLEILRKTRVPANPNERLVSHFWLASWLVSHFKILPETENKHSTSAFSLRGMDKNPLANSPNFPTSCCQWSCECPLPCGRWKSLKWAPKFPANSNEHNSIKGNFGGENSRHFQHCCFCCRGS